MSRKSYVSDNGDGCYAHIEIDSHIYRFTIEDVDPSARAWLVDVLERQMQEVHDKAKRQTILQFQESAKQLFGL